MSERAGEARRWALVPAKPFAEAKSRLAPAMAAAERRTLAERLLDHVLAELRATGLFDPRRAGGIALLSRDPALGAWAAARGALVLDEPAPSPTAIAMPAPLSHVVDAGLAALAARGAEQALVLMADLPLLAAAEVARMVALGGPGRIVVAPDAAGEGTNALLLTPPDAIATCFGREGSLRRHRERAAAAGLAVAVHAAPALAFDLDTVDDLRRYESGAMGGNRP